MKKTMPFNKKQGENTVGRESTDQSASLNIMNYNKSSISLRVEFESQDSDSVLWGEWRSGKGERRLQLFSHRDQCIIKCDV